MTPAMFYMGLKSGRLEGLHQVTLMVFDECHHASGGNNYNLLMGQYVDHKVKLQRGDNDIPRHLPQVTKRQQESPPA